MEQQMVKGFVGMAVSMGLALSAAGEVLVAWDMLGEPGDQETTEPIFVAEGLSVVSFTRVGGAQALTGPDTFNTRRWTNDSRGVDFGLIVEEGYQLDLTSFSLQVQGTGTSPMEVGLFHSEDNFSNPIHLFEQWSWADNVYDHPDIDLSSLSGIQDEVTFRFRATSDETPGGNDLDGDGVFRLANLGYFEDFSDGTPIQITGELTAVETSVSYQDLEIAENVFAQRGGSARIAAGEGAVDAIQTDWSDQHGQAAVASVPGMENLPLEPITDTLELTGLDGELYTLEMDFSDDYWEQTGYSKQQAAEAGLLFLATYDEDAEQWVNAVTMMHGEAGTLAQEQFEGGWEAFVALHDIDEDNLADYLGSWGYDLTGNTVWAVIDHNSHFAVVPEPATVALIPLIIVATHRPARQQV